MTRLERIEAMAQGIGDDWYTRDTAVADIEWLIARLRQCEAALQYANGYLLCEDPCAAVAAVLRGEPEPFTKCDCGNAGVDAALAALAEEVTRG